MNQYENDLWILNITCTNFYRLNLHSTLVEIKSKYEDDVETEIFKELILEKISSSVVTIKSLLANNYTSNVLQKYFSENGLSFYIISYILQLFLKESDLSL